MNIVLLIAALYPVVCAPLVWAMGRKNGRRAIAGMVGYTAIELLLILALCLTPGDKTLVLVGLYAAMQVVFESLRRDEFLRWGFVRCSELLSAVALFIVLLCYQLRSGRVWKKRHIACWIGYVVLVVSCILLEFATEERIPFLTFLSPEACYVCMTGCCALLCGCVMVMRSTEPVKS